MNENCANFKVLAGDFEHALLNLTPSNRRHVSQYDLVSLQKPQSYLYDVQAKELRSRVIDPLLKKSILVDASGKAVWQVIEPLAIKVEYDPAVHPECFVWRFVCGMGDSLDGFTLHPVDLLTIADDAAGLESCLWRGLIDAKMKGGAFAALFKGFSGLKRRGKKIFMRTMKRFLATLMPGEPIILMYTSESAVDKECNGSVDTISPKNNYLKKFKLSPPCDEQLAEYFNFTMRSIYRLQSDQLPFCSEDEFIEGFHGRPDHLRSIEMLERWRMEMGDKVRRDFKGFIEEYFAGLSVSERQDMAVKDLGIKDVKDMDTEDKDKEDMDTKDAPKDTANNNSVIDQIVDSYTEHSEAPEDVLF